MDEKFIRLLRVILMDRMTAQGEATIYYQDWVG